MLTEKLGVFITTLILVEATVGRNAEQAHIPQGLTLQIPTYIPQFNPHLQPYFDLGSANSFHSIPIIQPKREIYTIPVTSPNTVYPQIQPLKRPIHPQIVTPEQKGIIHFSTPQATAQNQYFIRHPQINYQIPPKIPQNQKYIQNFRPYAPYFKPVPLINSQIRHPIQNGGQKQPKMHAGFKPTVPVEQKPEEVKESQEPEESFDFDENFFKNSRYSFPRFNEDEDEKDDKNKGSYEVEDHESQEEQDESTKRFVVTNPFLKQTKNLSKIKSRF